MESGGVRTVLTLFLPLQKNRIVVHTIESPGRVRAAVAVAAAAVVVTQVLEKTARARRQEEEAQTETTKKITTVRSTSVLELPSLLVLPAAADHRQLKKLSTAYHHQEGGNS